MYWGDGSHSGHTYLWSKAPTTSKYKLRVRWPEPSSKLGTDKEKPSSCQATKLTIPPIKTSRRHFSTHTMTKRNNTRSLLWCKTRRKELRVENTQECVFPYELRKITQNRKKKNHSPEKRKGGKTGVRQKSLSVPVNSSRHRA